MLKCLLYEIQTDKARPTTCGPKKVPRGARSKNGQSDLIQKSLSECEKGTQENKERKKRAARMQAQGGADSYKQLQKFLSELENAFNIRVLYNKFNCYIVFRKF